jgi:tRNA A37 N6-isopentenylltransferase MiaA
LVRGQPLEDALASAKGETRKYAKQQLTWLRRTMIAWNTIETQQTERMLTSSLLFIDG